MDVAALGFEIDSKNIEKSTKALNDQSAAADKAAKSADKVVASNDKVAESAKRSIAQYEHLGSRTVDFGVKQEKAINSTGAMATVLDRAAISTSRLRDASGKYSSGAAQMIANINGTTEANVAASASYQKLLSDLNFQHAQLGRTAKQQEIFNNLRMAGAKAGSAESIAIVEATKSLQFKQAALEQTAVKAAFLATAMGKVVAGGIALAGAAVAAFGMHEFVTASIEAETAQTKLAAALEATGGRAGQTLESLNTMAADLQKITVFEDDAIGSAQALILTFGRIKGDTFEKTTKAVLDMATVLGMDLNSAALQLGKALNDPVKGMSTLRRSGIDFTKAEKAMAQQMIDTGNVAGAQELILKKLEGRFGGSAEAMRNTLGGALKSLKNSWGNLFELGKGSTDPLREAVESLIKAIEDPAFVSFVQTIGKGLFGAATLAVEGITLLIEGFNALIAVMGSAGKLAVSLGGMFVDGFVWLVKDSLEVANKFFGVDLVAVGKDSMNKLIGLVVAGFLEMEFTFKHLPLMLAIVFTQGVNAVVSGINSMIEFALKGINFLAEKADWVLNKVGSDKRIGQIGGGLKLDPIGMPDMSSVTQGGDAFALSPLDEKKFAQSAAMKKKWLDEMGGSAKGAADETKKLKGAHKDLDDELDHSKGTDKAGKAYEKLKLSVQEFIDKQKAERDGIGLSDQAMLELKYSTELLNKAKSDGLPITDTLIAQTKEWAKSMADAEAQTNAAKSTFEALKEGKEFIDQQKLIQQSMGLTGEAAARLKHETELLNKATANGTRTIGPEQIAQIKATAAEMASLETEVKDTQEALSFVKGIFSDLFSDLKDALISGKNLWEAFGNAALGVLSKIADKVFSMAIDGVFNALMGGGKSGGGIGGALSNLGGGSFSNIIQNTPTWLGGGGGMPSVGPDMGFPEFGPASTASSGIMGSGISAMGALGAVGGAAGGIMQLTSGKGGIGSTIGGIGSLIGAGVSLIPGIGQIAGPAIALLSNLLPSLFGGTPEPPTALANATLGFHGGSFGGTGTSSGGASPISLGATGQSMMSILGRAGYKGTDSSYNLSQATYSKGDFSNATTMVNGQQWAQSSDPQMQQQGLDTAAAHVAHQMLLELGSGISGVMREGLSQFGQQNLQHAFSTQELDDAVQKLGALSLAMDGFGKTSSEAENIIAQVDAQFAEMLATAKEFNLSAGTVDKILAEQNRKRLEATKDFTDGIGQMLLGLQNPLEASLQTNDIAFQKDLATNRDFLRLVDGYQDQRLNIETLYTLKRNKILDDANQEAIAAAQAMADSIKAIVDTLGDLIKSLMPGGELAGESATAKLAGLKSIYEIARGGAQASPLNQDMINQFTKAATDYITFFKDYSGNDASYVAERNRVIAEAQDLQARAGGMVTSSSSGSTGSSVSTNTQFIQLMSTVDNLTTQLAESQRQNAILVAKLDRYLAQPR